MPRNRVDAVITQLADYVMAPSRLDSELALRTAHLTLLDALGCALLATGEPDAVRTARPLFASAEAAQSRVIGTGWRSDPVQTAFANGTLIRWLDFNDAWLALEWGHPSDNFGALLAVTDHIALRSLDTARSSNTAQSPGEAPTVADLLIAGIQAYEIQGVLALGMALNRHGLDHVANVRIASAAVATRLLGGGHAEVTSAITHAWADGGALRTYRHAPNVTARKSWAAGDATSRAVRLAYLALRGEEPVRSVLTTPTWGFSDALLGGATLALDRELGSYIMENVLLKPAYPTEYHAQTAVEAAVKLRPQLGDLVHETAVHEVARIEIRTHEAAVRIISKSGPLTNPADRDHCLEYIVAVALLYGEVTSRHYHDDIAADPRIDQLRALTQVTEDTEYSKAYLDPNQRAVANALRVHFIDGTATDWVEVRIPLGHPARREQAEPYVTAKLHAGLAATMPERAQEVASALADGDELLNRPVSELVDLVTPADTQN
jgi:2-methylcitrate dehydratase